MADFCVFCGVAMARSWLCEVCGATPARPWPATAAERPGPQITIDDDYRPDEVRPLTALFADIVGSTALGEQLAVDEVKTLIGECVSKMTLAIEEHRGEVRSFMGDGLAAFFGLECSHEDDPVRAAFAGLRIIEVIGDYAHEIESAWGIEGFSVRVGINSGWVAAGMVGGADPQFVALGDAVNVAARLQANAEPASIIVGGSSAVRLASRFDLERLGEIGVRGRKQSVEAWRLLGYKGEPESPGGPFVGRLNEIRAADRCLEELELGRGQILIVVGDGGIGKSRLLSEYQSRAPGTVQWLCGRCSHEHLQGPYGPFAGILRAWLEIDAGVPAVLARIRLTARMRELFEGKAAEILPYLGQLVSVELDPAMESEFHRHSPEDRANAIRLAYVTWVRRLALDGPVAVVIDDTHRADASTEALLRELFALADEAPVLLILALRPETEVPGWSARTAALDRHVHRTTELWLRPLDPEEGDELMMLLDPESRLSGAVRRELCLRGEGNPLYLEELSRAALMAAEDGGERVFDPLQLELPPALEGLLMARIDRVSAGARRVLQVAAVCGRRFDKTVIGAAMGQGSLGEELIELVREGLLREDGRQPHQCFTFRHGLCQKAVLKTLPGARLRELHDVVGRVLEVGEMADVAPEVIASHFLESGHREKAVEYLEKAALRASSLSSLGEALEFFDAARELRESMRDGRGAWAMAHAAAKLTTELGRYEDASGRWKELLDIAMSGADRAVALLEIARTDHELHNGILAERACLDALDEGPDEDTRTALELLLAKIALREGKLEEARKLLELNRKRQDSGKVLAVERALLWASVFVKTGDFERAAESSTTAVKCAQECGEFSLELGAKRSSAVIDACRGRLREAGDVLEWILAESMSAGYTIRAQEAVGNLLYLYFLTGDLAKGLELGREALMWVSTPRWRTTLLDNLARIELEVSPLEQAEDRIRECLEVGEGEAEAKLTTALALTRLAKVELLRGDLRASREKAEEGLAMSGELQGRDDVAVEAHVQLAKIALEEGVAEEALEHARAAVELSHEADPSEAPLAWRILGMSEAALGLPSARDTLTKALEMARSMEMRLEEARACMALGSLDGGTQNEYFHRARELFSACASERGLAELERVTAAVRTA